MTSVPGSCSQNSMQVVARDVGLVADAHELRDAHVQRAGVVEDGEAQRAALRREGHAARRHFDRRERGVHHHGGIGVQDAEAVRARPGACL